MGRASGFNGRENGEVDEPGGPSSAKPGKTRDRLRSHVNFRGRIVEKGNYVDMDADARC